MTCLHNSSAVIVLFVYDTVTFVMCSLVGIGLYYGAQRRTREERKTAIRLLRILPIGCVACGIQIPQYLGYMVKEHAAQSAPLCIFVWPIIELIHSVFAATFLALFFGFWTREMGFYKPARAVRAMFILFTLNFFYFCLLLMIGIFISLKVPSSSRWYCRDGPTSVQSPLYTLLAIADAGAALIPTTTTCISASTALKRLNAKSEKSTNQVTNAHHYHYAYSLALIVTIASSASVVALLFQLIIELTAAFLATATHDRLCWTLVIRAIVSNFPVIFFFMAVAYHMRDCFIFQPQPCAEEVSSSPSIQDPRRRISVLSCFAVFNQFQMPQQRAGPSSTDPSPNSSTRTSSSLTTRSSALDIHTNGNSDVATYKYGRSSRSIELQVQNSGSFSEEVEDEDNWSPGRRQPRNSTSHAAATDVNNDDSGDAAEYPPVTSPRFAYV